MCSHKNSWQLELGSWAYFIFTFLVLREVVHIYTSPDLYQYKLKSRPWQHNTIIYTWVRYVRFLMSAKFFDQVYFFLAKIAHYYKNLKSRVYEIFEKLSLLTSVPQFDIQHYCPWIVWYVKYRVIMVWIFHSPWPRERCWKLVPSAMNNFVCKFR